LDHTEPLKLHSIVNAIGKRHAVNLDKVRLMLVQKWLTQDAKGESQFKEIILPSTRFQVLNTFFKINITSCSRLLQIGISQGGESESLIQQRILYLLKSSQFENNCIQLLLTFAYQVIYF
jgi:hypothetical protein